MIEQGFVSDKYSKLLSAEHDLVCDTLSDDEDSGVLTLHDMGGVFFVTAFLFTFFITWSLCYVRFDPYGTCWVGIQIGQGRVLLRTLTPPPLLV